MNEPPLKSLTRRHLLLKAILAASGSAILQSCKTKASRSDAPAPPTASTTPGAGPASASDPKAGEATTPTTPQAKDSNQQVKACSGAIDLSLYKPVSEYLWPEVKLYGDAKSSMLVIGLPKYTHKNLQSIFVLTTKGDVIAQKGITAAADITPDLRARPIVFDHLALGGERRLAFIFKTACNQCDGGSGLNKFLMTSDLVFENQFRGKPVYGLTPSSVYPNFMQNQAFPDFLPNPDFFESSSGQGLQISTEAAQFDSSGGFKNFVITDMFGKVLSENGLNQDGDLWTDIANNSQFICYRLVSDQFYIRTMMRLS